MNAVLRWTRYIAFLLLALVVIAALVSVWLWQSRHSIDDIGWPTAEVVSEPTDMVTVTWLGTSTLLFDDRETQVLIDGNFTRLNPVEIALFLRVSSSLSDFLA